MYLGTKSYDPCQRVRIVEILLETNIFENHEYLCFKTFMDLIIIWNFLKTRNMMNI